MPMQSYYIPRHSRPAFATPYLQVSRGGQPLGIHQKSKEAPPYPSRNSPSPMHPTRGERVRADPSGPPALRRTRRCRSQTRLGVVASSAITWMSARGGGEVTGGMPGEKSMTKKVDYNVEPYGAAETKGRTLRWHYVPGP